MIGNKIINCRRKITVIAIRFITQPKLGPLALQIPSSSKRFFDGLLLLD